MKKFIGIIMCSVIMMSGFQSTIYANEIYNNNGQSIETRAITANTYIYATQEVGGRGSALYEHYGNFKYDGRAFFENIGESVVHIDTYTSTGYHVHSFGLDPGEQFTATFTQAGLKYNLADGYGKVSVSTPDGSTGIVYFRYNVLND